MTRRLLQAMLRPWNPMFCDLTRALILLIVFSILLMAGPVRADPTPACRQQATENCYFTFQPTKQPGKLHYFASRSPDQRAEAGTPDAALIVLHGHPRDANITFNAALSATEAASKADSTVVIAPVFQVASAEAKKCSTPGVPAAQSGDLLWTCSSWMDGGEATGAPGMTSFAAMDALITDITRRWPSIRVVTVAGFSAGAQMVQHYIGFAKLKASLRVTVRYVVSDPGTWLYFDSVRPVDVAECADASCRVDLSKSTTSESCPNVNQWKYGTEGLPSALGRAAAEARAHYASADVDYLEAARDSGPGKGTYSHILDKTCAAEAQGTFRLQRGLAYAAYDRQLIAPDKHREVVVVPDCAHDVACVFTSPSARAALLGPSH